jgi:hypothetical protein
VQTAIIVEEIPRLLRELGVESMLDVPCGDFFWMNRMDLAGTTYVGGDIVQEIVDRNIREYQRQGLAFMRLDLISDDLPRADLVFVRDCLVHLSYDDISLALRNICDSGADYLLTTTFPGRSNHDIPTGRWRPIDLQADPFHLPPPLKVINEGCTEGNGQFHDKSLALWRVRDVYDALGRGRAATSGN